MQNRWLVNFFLQKFVRTSHLHSNFFFNYSASLAEFQPKPAQATRLKYGRTVRLKMVDFWLIRAKFGQFGGNFVQNGVLIKKKTVYLLTN
jgi:hypothetical protein